MITSLPGSSIVSSSGRAALLDSFRKRITERMAECETEESLELLRALRSHLIAERESTCVATAELASLAETVGTVTTADEYIRICETLRELLSEQFSIRPSSATLYSISLDFFDRIFSRLLDSVAEGAGHGGTIFVSGELGRGESLCARRSSILFIYPDSCGNDEPPEKTAARELEQALTKIFPFINADPRKGSSWFWSGSLSEWQGLAATAISLTKGKKSREVFGFSGILATLADARFICGNVRLAKDIEGMNRALLEKALSGDYFRNFARDVSSMQVALGIFGRLRTVKHGRQMGKFPLTEQAVNPLIDAVRTLAATFAISDTSTAGRLKALLELGVIGVALGEKLLAAWQMLTREMVRLELEDSSADELFLDIDKIDDEEKEQIKASLEELTTLQRLLYQQMSSETA